MKVSRLVLYVAVAVAILVVLPAFLSHSLVNAVNQMLIAALFACAFNILCGQGGMLSFGHSAYFAIGSFATLHAMGVMSSESLLPTPLLPLAGALVGLMVGLVAGWFSTQRTGVYFSMITLALAELLHTIAPHLRGLFGGEAGISSMRMPALGITFGSDIHVYYLTLAWVVAAVGAMYFLTFTPLGRLIFALRENTHRLRFLGYNVHNLGTITFALSAMFSGIAGGLQAITIETSNYSAFEMHLSAEVLLNAYIGGVQVFFGPLIGAGVMTFFGNAVSDMTRNWLLYKGIIFVLVMMFMPTGIAGLLKLLGESFRKYSLPLLVPALLLSVVSTILLTMGTVFTVEMMQRGLSQDYQMLARAAGSAGPPPILLFGREWFPGSLITWLLSLGLLVGGGFFVWFSRSRWKMLKETDEDESVLLPKLGDGSGKAGLNKRENV